MNEKTRNRRPGGSIPPGRGSAVQLDVELVGTRFHLKGGPLLLLAASVVGVVEGYQDAVLADEGAVVGLVGAELVAPLGVGKARARLAGVPVPLRTGDGREGDRRRDDRLAVAGHATPDRRQGTSAAARKGRQAEQE